MSLHTPMEGFVRRTSLASRNRLGGQRMNSSMGTKVSVAGFGVGLALFILGLSMAWAPILLASSLLPAVAGVAVKVVSEHR